jgi:hypothetical protein
VAHLVRCALDDLKMVRDARADGVVARSHLRRLPKVARASLERAARTLVHATLVREAGASPDAGAKFACKGVETRGAEGGKRYAAHGVVDDRRRVSAWIKGVQGGKLCELGRGGREWDEDGVLGVVFPTCEGANGRAGGVFGYGLERAEERHGWLGPDGRLAGNSNSYDARW